VCAFYFSTTDQGNAVSVETITHIFDAKYFARVFLSDIYPTFTKNLQIKIPKGVSVDILEFNFEDYSITKNEFIDPKTGDRLIDYKALDIPEINDDNIPGPEYVYPYIILIPETFESHGETHHIFSSDSALYDWYFSLLEKNINGVERLNDLVNSIVDTEDSDRLKIQKVFKWVQQNIRYIAFEYGIGGFKPDEAISVLENKYGDCKGMTSLLVVLLNQIEIDAHYCWITTNKHPYKERFPSPAADDHMICVVRIDTGFLYLDATNKYQTLGEVDERIQGKMALIEDGKESFIIQKLPETPHSANSINTKSNLTIINDTIFDKVKVFYTGLSKHMLQFYLNDVSGSYEMEAMEQLLKGHDTNMEVYDIHYEVSQLSEERFDLNFKVKKWNKIIRMDELLFIPIDDGRATFKTIDTARNYLYSIGDRHTRTLQLILHIPDSLDVSYLPETSSYTSEDFSYHFTYNQQGDSIIYNKRFEIKNSLVEPEYFQEWNDFLKRYNKQCEEMIILTGRKD